MCTSRFTISHYIFGLLLFLIPATSVNAQVFTIGDRYPTSTNPIVVTGDFDGDQDIDLAIAHRDEYEIWIYSNDGAAVFSHSQTITGCEYATLSAADLNGDGYDDLMWFDEFTVFDPPWGLTMYFNNGDGTFYEGFKDTIGSKLICVADFNGDDIVDVGTYGRISDTTGILILLGTGGGNFAPATRILPGAIVSAGIGSLAAADLDHDADNDIIFMNNAGTYSLLNNGDGTFADTIRTGGLGLAPVADIDGDGFLDMVGMIPGFACDFVPAFALSEHDGTFTAGRMAWLTAGVLNGAAVGAADYNGDGFADIAWHPRDLSRVTIGFNNGRSVFREFERISEVAAGGRGIKSVDLDSDGDIDLMIVGADDTLTIALSQAAQHNRRIFVPGDFPSVQEAVDYAWNLDTVFVDPGIYYENINFNGKNIVLMSSEFADLDEFAKESVFSTQSFTTIIDGGDADRVFLFDHGEDDRSVIAGFIIQHGNAAGQGGGVYCDDSTSPTIMNNIFRENYASNGGGAMSLVNCSASVKNNLIINNSTGWWGGGVFIGGHFGDFINNTVYGNTTVNGGGGLCFARGTPTICNNIFWGNSSTANGQQVEYIQTTPPTIIYSVIEGGWPGEGNITDYPMFVDTAGRNFNLMAGSPCIDAGDPNAPPDPDGSTADIGAYYYPTPVDVDDDFGGVLPYSFALAQNYPNPFNPVTTIEYTLAKRCRVTLEVYNLLGQKIRSLVDREESAGSHRVVWEGKSANGQPVSTGVYLYRFQAGESVHIRKMVLVK